MQTAVTVGPTVYEQRRGVPIGGFMSKQFASVFVGYAEPIGFNKCPLRSHHNGSRQVSAFALRSQPPDVLMIWRLHLRCCARRAWVI